MKLSDIPAPSVGYIVFGILAVIAIIYMVKFSIEIDDENYKQQMIANANYQTASRKNSHNSNGTNFKYSPNLNNSFITPSMDGGNTSISSQNDFNRPYNINTNNHTNILIPPRQTFSSPKSATSNSSNQFGNYMPANNFRTSINYNHSNNNNRQSRQFLLQNVNY